MSPAIVRLKALFQEVCMMKCDWDVSLSNEFVEKWTKVLTSLQKIGVISLPRHYLSQFDLNYVEKIELHGLSDESNIASAAVIYVRILLSDKQILINLVASKTKITPLKTS